MQLSHDDTNETALNGPAMINLSLAWMLSWSGQIFTGSRCFFTNLPSQAGGSTWVSSGRDGGDDMNWCSSAANGLIISVAERPLPKHLHLGWMEFSVYIKDWSNIIWRACRINHTFYTGFLLLCKFIENTILCRLLYKIAVTVTVTNWLLDIIFRTAGSEKGQNELPWESCWLSWVSDCKQNGA